MATNRRSAESGFAVAVSDSEDPTQGWTGFEIDGHASDTSWVDFPMMGINADGLFVSANLFSNAADAFTGLVILVVPKDDLTGAVPTVAGATLFYPLQPFLFGAFPAVDLDGSASAGVLLADLSIIGSLFRLDIAGDVTNPVLVGPTEFATDPYGFPPPGPQPGPKAGLETGEVFSSAPVLRDGTAWAVSGVDVDGRAALRWLQIDLATNEILQTGLISDSELAFYYGSIAVNEFGDV